MPFNIGAPELIIILVIALLILGPGKLPEVGSSVGKAIREFRKASSDVEDVAKIDVSPLPATAPVCAMTAARPRSERPLFRTITGLPASAALRTIAMNFCGFLFCSAKTMTVFTAGSPTSASR